MPITFGKFKDIIYPYAGRAGKCVDSPEVSRFAREVMEYLLLSGSVSAVQKLDIFAHKGKIVLPPEVEIPIKAKINGERANIWNQWYTLGASDGNIENARDAFTVMAETGVRTPLAYGIPGPESILGVLSTCEEEPGAEHIIIQGKDITGREIYTWHKDQKVVGEKLHLKKNQITYGNVKFAQVTGVVKPQTNGYVACYAVDPELGETKQFLADWPPSEERPLYREYVLTGRGSQQIVEVSMLVRARLKDNYSDNELTLFDNSLAIRMAAQKLQAETNADLNSANYKDGAVSKILDAEAAYKKPAGQPVQVYRPLSGGAVKNIV
jgi:hypothetical protein